MLGMERNEMPAYTEITEKHIGSLSLESRKALGQYMTPASIGDVMADMLDLDPASSPDVLDPACGTGELLLAVQRACPNAHLFGFDIDEGMVDAARENVPDSKFESEMRGGLFFYRCRIDEVDYYVYLIEDDGVYRQEKIPVERTSIKETSGHPKVVKSSKYVQNTLPNWIRFNMNSLEKISESDTLYVPVGTISECSKFVAF